MKIIKKYWPILLLALITIVTFYQLPQAYFEQDEWHSFGHYIYLNSLSPIDFLKNVFPGGELGHFTPLSLMLKMTMYKIWGLNATSYFYISILLHFFVGVAFYSLVYLLTSKKYIAFLGAVFFLVNNSHYQAVTWLGTFEGTQGATLFGLLSLTFYILYQQKGKFKFFVLSLITILFGLFFKETALGFVLVLITLILMAKRLTNKKRLLLYLFSILGLYLIFRLSLGYFSVHNQSAVVSGNRNIVDIIIYNQLVIPPKLFFQALLPLNIDAQLTNISSLMSSELSGFLGYPINISDNQLVIFAYFFMAIILCSLLLIIVKEKTEVKDLAIIGVLLIFFTSTPLLPIRKFSLFLDSRYLYPATLGMGMILATLIFSFKNSKYLRIIVFTLLTFLILIHSFLLRETINELVTVGQERRAILSQIKTIVPRLSEKTIIFAESDEPFYGLADRILPFQSGLGQTLLVSYQQLQNIPADFFTNEFLWDIKDEGYKKYENLGFGFFWDLDNLMKVVVEDNLPLESVYGIAYDTTNKKIINITSRVRGEITGISDKKKLVDLSSAILSASYNQTDVRLAVDGQRETYWDSQIPYFKPQYFEIDLGKNLQISKISIDSFDNKDQNEVGYKIETSLNGINWQEVFWVKRRPPLQSGLVSIYLPHILARYIRIDQIGYHQFAPWVINELKIYEKID